MQCGGKGTAAVPPGVPDACFRNIAALFPRANLGRSAPEVVHCGNGERPNGAWRQ